MSELVTGEAVVLDLPVAYFPGRIAALLIDYAIQLVLLIGFGFAMAALLGSLNDDYLIAAYLALYVAIAIGYPTAFETLTRGKTPGKMALGIRVVGDDGSPVRFRQAFVRSLVGLFELASLVLMPVALITSLGSAKGKRLGDMFAGTYVVQDRMPARPPLHRDFAVVPFPLEGWAQTAEVSRLSPQTADAAASYLRRFGELNAGAREALGLQLANAVAAQVSPPPPPGTPPPAYLAAVLAVRRERDQARLAASREPAAGPALAMPAAPVPAWPAPAAQPAVPLAQAAQPPEPPGDAPAASGFAPPA
jgi:uncharacterized RDD family membrane protein YckC